MPKDNDEPLKEAAAHPITAIAFSLIFQAFSNIQGFDVPQIANFGLELGIIMMISQVAIGAAYALQSDKRLATKDGLLYIGGTIFGVWVILQSTLKMDLLGWIGAFATVLLTGYVLIKRNSNGGFV